MTMTKRIAFIAFALAACSSQQPTPNLAAAQMAIVDPGAKCDPWYTDVGAEHVHSASCTTSGKDLVYCRVEVGKPLTPCQTLVPGPAALAKAQEEAQQRARGPQSPASAEAKQ